MTTHIIDGIGRGFPPINAAASSETQVFLDRDVRFNLGLFRIQIALTLANASLTPADIGESAIDRNDVESNIQRDGKSSADRLNLEFVCASVFAPLAAAVQDHGLDHCEFLTCGFFPLVGQLPHR